MSATDSDNSIDWLASDTDDSNSEHESERSRKPSGEASARAPRSEPWNRDAADPPRDKMKRRRSFTEEEDGGGGGRLLSSPSDKGRLFTRKCMELQCYIQPLSSILNGLRSGRYRERLSTFQESVAMDRIQRILGVLHKPYLGENYISIILKMEEMLKSWFPNVKAQEVHLHLTKKLKPSPPTTATPIPASPSAATAAKPLRVTDLTPPGSYSANNLKWLHTSPICSPKAAAPPLRDLTQDSAVSSSTDGPAHRDSATEAPPPPAKINAPCLERLLKSTESIICRKGTSGTTPDDGWS
ncbi:uncharacterized protein ciartb [Stigmatopora nigra]